MISTENANVAESWMNNSKVGLVHLFKLQNRLVSAKIKAQKDCYLNINSGSTARVK